MIMFIVSAPSEFTAKHTLPTPTVPTLLRYLFVANVTQTGLYGTFKCLLDNTGCIYVGLTQIKVQFLCSQL